MNTEGLLAQPKIELNYKPPRSPVFVSPVFLCAPCGEDSSPSDSPAGTSPARHAYDIQEEMPHDRLPALVFSLHPVLAHGPGGPDPVSHRVAAIATLPPGRHRCPRSSRPGLGRSDASRAPAQRPIPFFKNLKDEGTVAGCVRPEGDLVHTPSHAYGPPDSSPLRSPSSLRSRFSVYLQVSLSL